MKKEILNAFENFRLEIIKKISEEVKSKKNQTIVLKDNEDFRISDDRIVKQIYKSLHFSDEKLTIEYSYGEGFEPVEITEISEELDMLSANEIYEIICAMPD